jgi:hypothetical protein
MCWQFMTHSLNGMQEHAGNAFVTSFQIAKCSFIEVMHKKHLNPPWVLVLTVGIIIGTLMMGFYPGKENVQ